MENEELDQPTEEETEEVSEETPEETPEEVSEEPEKEPITLEKIEELVSALQKGYTLTRQDLSAIRQNQEAIQENLNRKSDEFGDDEPLTVKTLIKLQEEQRQKGEKEQQRVNEMIEGQVNELKARGVIHSKEEEDGLLSYAVKHKITDLFRAADIWSELQEAKKVGGKVVAQAKNIVKQEEGSKVGTSQKTKTEREQGVNYEEIHTKTLDELASEE